MRGVRLALALFLAAALCPTAAQAQQPCSFVLGFAEFVARAGDLVGPCTEEQRTLATPERVVVPGYGAVILQSGETVQATAHGLLRWDEQRATVEFLGRDGAWRIAEAGLALTRWEATAAQRERPPAVEVSVPEPLRPAWEALTGLDVVVDGGTLTMGRLMAETAAVTGVQFQIAPMPTGTSGRYQVSDNSLTVNATLMGEDPRALASVLAHELMHARQVHAGRGARSDCVGMEVEAHVTGALVWVSSWTDRAPPTGTALERELTRLAQTAASEGEPGVYRLVVDTPGYQDQCELWVPDEAVQSPQPAQPEVSSRPSLLTAAIRSRCVNVVSNAMKGLPINQGSSGVQASLLARCLRWQKTPATPA